MNFLAHLFLSFDDYELIIGNFIADHVKGARKNEFPDGIRRGIELHRAIDHFTDTHSITSRSKNLLYERHAKYAGVVVDLYYDHFLAASFSDYSEIPLAEFVENHYRILESEKQWLPESVRSFLPHMIERNWLFNYASIEGIGRTLIGLSQRVRFPNRMHEAVHDLELHYPALKADFKLFFPQLITFADEYLRNAALRPSQT